MTVVQFMLYVMLVQGNGDIDRQEYKIDVNPSTCTGSEVAKSECLLQQCLYEGQAKTKKAREDDPTISSAALICRKVEK